MVILDETGQVIRPALLWNDLRSAAAAADLIDELGGRRWWAERAGSVPTASFTVTKLRWLAGHEPANAARVARVMLPHDWLTWRLGAAEPVTDRGDASGTGYFATAEGTWLPDIAAAALGHEPALPRVAGPGETVGERSGGAVLGPGTGDNMAAAFGLGLQAGEVAVSVGTSGTAFAVTAVPAADPAGAVAGFADATGRFLPLVCTANAGLVMASAAALTGTDLAGLDQRALAAEPGAGGVILLPYFDGERTPNLPLATGVMSGITTRNATAENLARAAVEGVLCSVAEATDALGAYGVELRRVLLVGGGGAARKRSESWLPASSASMLTCPSPKNTSRLAPPARPPGSCRRRQNRPPGHGPLPSATAATCSPACGSATPPCARQRHHGSTAPRRSHRRTTGGPPEDHRSGRYSIRPRLAQGS